MMKKFFKKPLIFLIVLSLLYSDLPSNLSSDFQIPSAYAAVGDARVLYGDNVSAIPKSEFYTNSTNTFSAASATVASTANIAFTVSKESPTGDETVMATESTTGKLDIFCRSGSTWTKDISSVTVGTTGATRRFDVEYENTSGVPMVLYSRNVSGTNELGYYRKTGAGCGAAAWTGPINLDPTRITGTVLWVQLAARKTSGSNVLGAAFSDTSGSAGGTLESMIWNGTSWGNESPAASAQGWSDSSIELNGSAGANSAKVFDLAFETNTGQLLVFWGTSTGGNGTNGWRYSSCSGTLPCTWTSVNTPYGNWDDVTNIDCAPDPSSNQIACIAEGNYSGRLSAVTWNGTTVNNTTGNSGDTSLVPVAAGTSHVGVDWVVAGGQNNAIGVYAAATGIKYIYYDTSGGGWRINGASSYTITGSPATVIKSLQVQTNPNDKSQILVLSSDANSDLWANRFAYNGSPGSWGALNTWGASNSGVSLGKVSSITSQPFWFDWIKSAAAPSVSATISATAGSEISNLNSADTSKYINDPSCSSEGTCAAFKITATNGAATITSIKVTETGTVNANTTLTNPTLIYDTDNNFSNGTTGTFGSQTGFAANETATFTNAGLTIPSGSTYYFYIRFNLVNGSNYPSGGNTIGFQIASLSDVIASVSTSGSVPVNLVGTTAVKPVITSYTNSTESALNYSAACANCGVRLGPGSPYRQTVTINGYGFGADPGLGSRNSATNKVEIIGAVSGAFADDGSANTNISAWSNTAITIRTDTNITGNTDSDWGINYGGTNALRITAGGQTSATNLNFYLFPQVTSLTVPTAISNAAREYNASDSDGVITLNGTRFGSSAGTGWVRILGCDSGTCSSPSGTATVNSW